jgi:hypothetical protein
MMTLRTGVSRVSSASCGTYHVIVLCEYHWPLGFGCRGWHFASRRFLALHCKLPAHSLRLGSGGCGLRSGLLIHLGGGHIGGLLVWGFV